MQYYAKVYYMSSASGDFSPSPDMQASPSVGFTDTAARIGEYNPAEAEAINSNFNLVAYGIAHGAPGEDTYGHLPEVEVEYAGAEAIVDSLDPARGDALFIEDVGYEPTLAASDPSFKWSDHLDYLADARSNRSMPPGLYVGLLARAKGIPVVSADLTHQEVEGYNRTTGQDALVHGVNPEWPHYGSFHTRREQAVAYTAKEHALAALPTLNGNRPTYAVVYGKAHFDKAPGESDILDPLIGKTPGIPAAFSELGLNIETKILPDAWDARRKAALANLAGQLPDFPKAPSEQ
jgi:hypothetical protein